MTGAYFLAICCWIAATGFEVNALIAAYRAHQLERKGWNYHAEFEWPRATRLTLTAIGLLFLGLIFWLVA